MVDAPLAGKKPSRVLVIEDSLTVAMSLVRDLESQGWGTERAGTLAEGLELLDRENFDLVLLDLTLPDAEELDGLARVCAAHPLQAVVILTGHGDDELELKALDMGAQDYLLKGNHAQFLERTLRFSQQRSEVLRRNAEMAEEIQKNNEELEKLNQEKNNFVGMAAHDLKNPLGVVSGYVKLLAMDLGDTLSPAQAAMFERIDESTDFMLNLINDLLDVSAIESGGLGLRLQAGDIGELIERNVLANSELAKAKDIELKFLAPGERIDLKYDQERIEQVLNNLISNALKYSFGGTTVTVALSRAGNYACIAVKDQGQGIPESDLGDLFGAFSRASVETTGGETSTGLGLNICERIVNEHGGRFEVESTVGKGSCFTFFLPLDQRSEAP
ncbi:MAG: hybrid sensor histidine kinase/response regulator [Actinomycetia bacterium]|nr:hybrid sensor histidine kinase/response regulator [Actinomycetes bacterium]